MSLHRAPISPFGGALTCLLPDMPAPFSPSGSDTPDRLDALYRYDVLDTPPDETFDHVVELAAHLFSTPIAMVTLIDADRQWVKASVGGEPRDIDRRVSFCTHTICDDAVMVVEDATEDERFADNPFVAGEPGIRFYAGAPLTTPDGYRIGSLCVMDTAPRDPDAVQIRHLEHLARLVFGTAQAMLDADREDLIFEDRLCALTQCAFDQSWQWTPRGAQFTGPELPRRDFRIRKALKYLQDRVGDAVELKKVAREVGLSRPHFYKLFRAQVGLTPNLYVNALRMERAIEMLATSREAVADIGFDLGFSSQASFSRFFIGNGVVPPSAYRRSVHVA